MAFDSLFIGVTGLTAYQNQIDVISNNIANVGTIGYKGQNVTFQDLLYQNQSYASAPSQTRGGINAQQVGDGVKIGTIDTDFTQGGLQTTGINTNLAIDGDGFFTLNNIDGSGTPSYTRNGDFSLNQDGYLYDPSSGKAVLGYPDSAGRHDFAGRAAATDPDPVRPEVRRGRHRLRRQERPDGRQRVRRRRSAAISTRPTTSRPFRARRDPVTATTITTTVYDSLGGSHELQITYQPATGFATAA